MNEWLPLEALVYPINGRLPWDPSEGGVCAAESCLPHPLAEEDNRLPSLAPVAAPQDAVLTPSGWGAAAAVVAGAVGNIVSADIVAE